MQNIPSKYNIYIPLVSVMLGHAVGDALGVPVEFASREELCENPVTDMRGFGTYPVPAGSWSDDTSMALATLDSLAKGKVDYKDIMDNFVAWYTCGKYTPTDLVFDVGNTCSSSIERYIKNEGINPLECGEGEEYSNGNGSLMRIHPAAVILDYFDFDTEEAIAVIHNISSLTHKHKRSQIGCGIYTFVLWHILHSYAWRGKTSIVKGIEEAMHFYEEEGEFSHYKDRLDRLIKLANGDCNAVKIEEIKASGYVVDSLEAALYCLLTTDNYKDCVLKAVNLGDDTDTVGAIAGGLAGACYGYKAIPEQWLNTLIKRKEIETLCGRAVFEIMLLNGEIIF